MMEKLAGGLQIVRTRNVHVKPAVKKAEQLLLDGREQLAVTVDLIFRRKGQKDLLNEGEFISGEILEGQLVSDADRFPIDEVHVVAVFVFDCEVVAETKQLLAHQVTHLQSVAPESQTAQLKG
jgi:hypothetical protein